MRIVLAVVIVALLAGPAVQSSETEGDAKAHSILVGVGAGYGVFRFSNGLSESGLAYNIHFGFRAFRQTSLAVEINGWSPSLGSKTELQSVSPTALIRVGVSERLFLKAGVAFFSIEGNLGESDKSWSGSDTSPSIMFGFGYEVPVGTNISIAPTLQWMHQNVSDSGWSRTESGSDLITLVLSVWFH